MKKFYDVVNAHLVVGVEHVSNHLHWLLTTMIMDTVGVSCTDAIHGLHFSDNMPKDQWGEFENHSRTILINLFQHFDSARNQVQDEQFMYASIRVWLLSELLDSAGHEAHHAKVCHELNEYDSENLDEDGAKERGKQCWAFAEQMDVNIKSFGSLLDALLVDFYNELKEDIQDADCKEWKKLQFHMMDNNINYYNSDSGIEIRTIREVFQAQAQPEQAWIDVENDLFSPYVPKEGEKSEVAVATPTRRPDPVVASNTTTTTPAPAPAPVAEPVAEPATPAPVADPVISKPCADYDPLSDCSLVQYDPFDDDEPASACTSAPVVSAPIVDTSPTRGSRVCDH